MYKYYILSAFSIVLSLSSAKADNLRDSIGVENVKGKKVILHQVVAKDNYYSISRRYNVSPKTIITYNDNKYLSLGVVIKVPTEIPFTATAGPATASPATAGQDTRNSGSRTAATPGSGQPADVAPNVRIIEHAVQRKENLNMLAERYGTTVNEIKRVSELRSINLQIGQILKIPATKGIEDESAVEPGTQTAATTVSPSNTASAPVGNPVNTTPPVVAPAPSGNIGYKKPDTAKQKNTGSSREKTQPQSDVQVIKEREPLVMHTVAGNETMYSIATKYNLTLDQLKAKNNLSNNSLYVGQKLVISGQLPLPGEADEENDTSDAEAAGGVKNPSLRLPANRYGLSQMDEKGTGVWIVDPDLDGSKMLVLHRTAPIGTIMKISNPMTNRSTFAKVVGKFTENESTKDVIIVMTKAVADALGALDKRFLCNLTYSGQANEQ